jgi:hypothetical protein
MKASCRLPWFISRREFLAGATTALAGVSAVSPILPSMGRASPAPPDELQPDPWAKNSLLRKGQVYNESVEFADPLTGRASRRRGSFEPSTCPRAT